MKQERFKIVPFYQWHHVSGRKVSFYGAAPTGDGWQVVECGYTVQWADGTQGFGRYIDPETRKDAAKIRALAEKMSGNGWSLQTL